MYYCTKRHMQGKEMKKCDYLENHLPSHGERQEEINEAKGEDRELPVFSREVPVSSKRRETEGGIEVRYSWKEPKSPSLKVKRMVFKKSEKLGDLYRIDQTDGRDRLVMGKRGKTYILRKTTADIARALYRVAEKISDAVERIIGYLESLLGNFYVISLVEREAWTFDGSIVSDEVHYIDVANMQDRHRKKLSELIVEKLSALHSKNLVIGKFSLDNILVHNDDLKFTDLRGLRASRRKSFTVEEFKNILKYLLSAGMTEKEDVVPAIAYYSSENCENCREWYSETFGEDPETEYDVVSKLEEDVLN